jgi:hypothetical protein
MAIKINPIAFTYQANGFNIFMEIFKEFPSTFRMDCSMKSEEAVKELINSLQIPIFRESHDLEDGEIRFVSVDIGRRILIEEHGAYMNIHCSIETIETARRISEKVMALPDDATKKKVNNIHVLCFKENSYGLKRVTLDSIEYETINYGQKFEPVHNTIIHSLENNKVGIILLHGAPGTGKTTYIKTLTSLITRKFIIVPNYLIGQISSPALITFLLEQGKPILVLEDAENAVASRENGNKSSSISELLNISDGLLGQAMGCTVVATFNTKFSNIDEALKRKGRLIAEHEFAPLPIEDVNALLKHINKEAKATKPMTLAEIYGIDVNQPIAESKSHRIGFRMGSYA